MRFTCPACGADLLVPAGHDDVALMLCEVCGAHVLRRGSHLHLVWDHREPPTSPHDHPHRSPVFSY